MRLFITMLYNMVSFSNLKKKEEEEDCTFPENIGLHVFCITQNNKTTFNAVRQKNGTCKRTDFIMSHLGMVYQSFLGSDCTFVHSSL